MRHKYALFIMFIGMILMLLPAANAQSIDATLEDTLTDDLTSTEDLKWYRFEMAEPGDASIIIRGLQDHWDGWTYHWIATIYASDCQTALAEEKVRGYNAQYSPPTEFSFLDLESGTYYIKICSAGKNSFTTEPYQIELTKTYRSTQPFVSSDGSIYTIEDEPFTDRLSSADQVQRYAFEMDEPGDAIISVTGLQETWDGYTYHWRCAIYKDDLATIITYADVRGYAEGYGPSIICAPNLDAGTYYVQMASASSANPLMTSFTSDPYEICLLKYYHSASAAYSGTGYQTFKNSGDILWAFDGTAFIKLSNGEAFGALMKTKGGAIVPILISTDAAAVEYMISDTGEKITAAGPWHHEILDTNYYYSACGDIDRYTSKSIKTSSLPILYIDTNGVISAAEKVADQLGETEYGALKYWLMKNKGILGGAGGIILLIIIWCLLPHSKSSENTYYSSYSGTSGSTASYDHRLHDELDAVQHAINITEKYGDDWTGYDPEAPGPDPEAPIDSSEIW